MQSYLIERFLERLAQSRWRDDVVVKGGVLIASLVGVESRTTMDLDTTIRGFTLSHETAQQVFQEVASIPCDDDWTFLFDRTVDIRETDDYPGIRVHLKAVYPPISVPFTIDVTTGDKITPAPIEYDYPKLFDDGSIRLFAYPLETVLAEKLETVISRGVTNTRLVTSTISMCYGDFTAGNAIYALFARHWMRHARKGVVWGACFAGSACLMKLRTIARCSFYGKSIFKEMPSPHRLVFNNVAPPLVRSCWRCRCRQHDHLTLSSSSFSGHPRGVVERMPTARAFRRA